MRIAATVPATTTRATTGGTASATSGPTASQIGIFKLKTMFNYILNSYDEELQIWIGNNMDKV